MSKLNDLVNAIENRLHYKAKELINEMSQEELGKIFDDTTILIIAIDKQKNDLIERDTQQRQQRDSFLEDKQKFYEDLNKKNEEVTQLLIEKIDEETINYIPQDETDRSALHRIVTSKRYSDLRKICQLLIERSNHKVLVAPEKNSVLHQLIAKERFLTDSNDEMTKLAFTKICLEPTSDLQTIQDAITKIFEYGSDGLYKFILEQGAELHNYSYLSYFGTPTDVKKEATLDRLSEPKLNLYKSAVLLKKICSLNIDENEDYTVLSSLPNEVAKELAKNIMANYLKKHNILGEEYRQNFSNCAQDIPDSMKKAMLSQIDSATGEENTMVVKGEDTAQVISEANKVSELEEITKLQQEQIALLTQKNNFLHSKLDAMFNFMKTMPGFEEYMAEAGYKSGVDTEVNAIGMSEFDRYTDDLC